MGRPRCAQQGSSGTALRSELCRAAPCPGAHDRIGNPSAGLRAFGPTCEEQQLRCAAAAAAATHHHRHGQAQVLDGRAVAAAWQEELARDVRDVLTKGGRPPGLGVVLVGSRPDSLLYVSRKREACERVGMFTEVRQLSASVTQRQLEAAVAALCCDPRIDGVLVQLPLPAHIDEEAVIDKFDPQKDVDGFHPLNMGRILMRGRAARFIPCTALGVIELLQRSGLAVRGKSVVVMGDSNIVGMPLAMLFRDAGAATVTVLHRTSYRELFTDATSAERATQRAQASACLPRIPGPVAAHAAGQTEAAVEGRAAPPAAAEAGAAGTEGASSQQQQGQQPQQQQQQQQQAAQQAEDEAAPAANRHAHPNHRTQHQPHLSDLPGITRTGDILVVAVGYPHLVKRDWVKPGAVVIDVGINVVEHGSGSGSSSSCKGSASSNGSREEDGRGEQRPAAAEGPSADRSPAEQWQQRQQQQHQAAAGQGGGGRGSADSSDSGACCKDGYREEGAQLQHPFHVVGDVEFCDVAEVAAAITPVPGGVGPMTIAAVLHNTVQAARHNLGLER
ncbi:hypothetical protein ABPG75_012972 [Micractinium tetrahymenae]